MCTLLTHSADTHVPPYHTHRSQLRPPVNIPVGPVAQTSSRTKLAPNNFPFLFLVSPAPFVSHSPLQQPAAVEEAHSVREKKSTLFANGMIVMSDGWGKAGGRVPPSTVSEKEQEHPPGQSALPDAGLSPQLSCPYPGCFTHCYS